MMVSMKVGLYNNNIYHNEGFHCVCATLIPILNVDIKEQMKDEASRFCNVFTDDNKKVQRHQMYHSSLK